MKTLPEREQQIRRSHAALIRQVVEACQNSDTRMALEPVLDTATQNGWTELVRVVRLILNGQRDTNLLSGLDEEDTVIVRSILQGIQNPASLPELGQQADPAMAGPGLAQMIHAASRGDAQALQIAALMAEQMTATQGDMRQLGGIMRRLIDGERDPDVLCQGMGPSGAQLVITIIDELNKLTEQ
ncbi:MAG: hypothetical protein LJE74_10705 [Proteobacteria bacterium]|jgi:hypothetical protein|nr:hypothetical protein [Pseudomonadota bacterium]